jgi:hypothetical protein
VRGGEADEKSAFLSILLRLHMAFLFALLFPGGSGGAAARARAAAWAGLRRDRRRVRRKRAIKTRKELGGVRQRDEGGERASTQAVVEARILLLLLLPPPSFLVCAKVGLLGARADGGQRQRERAATLRQNGLPGEAVGRGRVFSKPCVGCADDPGFQVREKRICDRRAANARARVPLAGVLTRFSCGSAVPFAFALRTLVL